jgi:hypothetical protein
MQARTNTHSVMPGVQHGGTALLYGEETKIPYALERRK